MLIFKLIKRVLFFMDDYVDDMLFMMRDVNMLMVIEFIDGY